MFAVNRAVSPPFHIDLFLVKFSESVQMERACVWVVLVLLAKLLIRNV